MRLAAREFLRVVGDHNDLHSEIDRELRQANIEIAFPQQDLHVRTIEVPLGAVLRSEASQKDAA
ncbi:MAG: hypothetical protein ABI614_15865 [Planctomycetota bacterium]